MSTPLGLGLSAMTSSGDPRFELDVGTVLARTFRVWLENLGPFLLVGLVVNSPVFLALGLIVVTASEMPLAQSLLDVLSNFLTLILTGAVTYGVFHSLRGQRATVGQILSKGLSRLGTVWLTGLLVGLGTLLGFCALIVPAFILMTRWWVAIPVAVIEDSTATESMRRSGELTSGNRWRVFALILVVGLITSGGAMVLAVALTAIQGATVGTGGQAGHLVAWAQALLQLLVLPLTALAAVTPAIVYHDLRVGREGADIDELLKIFE
jgi:hypothetical protein